MYEPSMSLLGFGDSVLVIDGTDASYRVGRFTGETRPESESFEIAVTDAWTGKTDYTSFFHKEDIWKNTKENAERLRNL